MDDSKLSTESSVEILIARELKRGEPAALIADQIAKNWELGKLTLPDRKIAVRFFFQNGFFESAVRVLRKDLAAGQAMPWADILEYFKSVGLDQKKETIDALLAGASGDKDLHDLAARGVLLKLPDPRWIKILAAEKAERQKENQERIDELLNKLQRQRAKNKSATIQTLLQEVRSLDAANPALKNFIEETHELEAMAKLEELKKNQKNNPHPDRPMALTEQQRWHEITPWIDRIKKEFDLRIAYEFAVGLHQMELSAQALDLLSYYKSQWTWRERDFEVQLLLALQRYAEVLERCSQWLGHETEIDRISEALYFSAKAYAGLESYGRAVSVIEALLASRPDFRDAEMLAREWQGLK
jgi:hypothetical protein